MNLAKIMLASRWILAPIYFGLSLALLILTARFLHDALIALPQLFTMAETDLVLLVLGLIDFALVGSLVLMVMLSGYENFISRFKKDENLEWLTTLDANSLKVKLATSIVAISSIHLLQVFMNAEHVDNTKLMWFALVHMTFVISAFVMGTLNRMADPH